MPRAICLVVSGLAMLAATMASATAGSFSAVDLDPSTAFFSVVSNGTFGWDFTPTSDITVTDLGFFDRDNDGLAVPHFVGIWDASENLLTSAVVASGTAAPLEHNFRYVPITPITLFSGQSYVIGANNPENYGHNETFALELGAISFDSSIVFIGQRWVQQAGINPTFGDTLSYPINFYPQNSFFGPNFQFEQAAVPEPSSFALLGIGVCLAGIGFAGRRRREEMNDAAA